MQSAAGGRENIEIPLRSFGAAKKIFEENRHLKSQPKMVAIMKVKYVS